MESFDYIIFVLSAILLVLQLWRMLQMKKTVRYRGSMPGQIGSAVLLGVLLVVAVMRRGDLAHTWPAYLVLAALAVAYVLCGAGLSDTGMYYGGRFLPFATIKYYTVDEHTAGQPILRLSRGGKEGAMYLKPEEKDAVIAFVEKQGIPKAEKFREDERRHLRQRAEGKARKK